MITHMTKSTMAYLVILNLQNITATTPILLFPTGFGLLDSQDVTQGIAFLHGIDQGKEDG